jgi:hypothetical protein
MGRAAMNAKSFVPRRVIRRAEVKQTVRKLPEFGVKQREERAVRESERLGPHRPPDAT